MTKRRHRNNRARLTARERVDGYQSALRGAGIVFPLGKWERAYLVKMLSAHAAATLARFKAKVAKGVRR